MLGNTGKFILFLLSYSPLLLFIIYHNLGNGIAIISCAVIFLVLLILSRFFISRVKKYNPQSINLDSVKNPSKEAITLHTVIYILPFATMDFKLVGENIPNYLILITLLAVIGYSFIKYRLMHVNPILALLFRYSIYEVNTGGEIFFLLSKKNIKSLQISDTLDVLQMADLLYVESDRPIVSS